VILAFGDQGTRDIYDGNDTEAARKVLPKKLWKVGKRKLDAVDAARTLGDLAAPRSNLLEKLHGNRRGWYSIRVNEQYRVIFRYESSASDVSFVDYH
jgi:proteic killer suppression protein